MKFKVRRIEKFGKDKRGKNFFLVELEDDTASKNVYSDVYIFTPFVKEGSELEGKIEATESKNGKIFKKFIMEKTDMIDILKDIKNVLIDIDDKLIDIIVKLHPDD